MSGPDFDVSVIIPTFNRCAILRRTLGLYAAQQGMNGWFEIVIGDDGSTDDTKEMLQAASASSPFPLRFVSLAINSGPSAARNKAIALAKGKILLFAGDDILPSPRFVAEHFEWHKERHPAVNAAVLGHIQWAPELNVTPFMRWLELYGTQFAYGRMKHGEHIDCSLLHTSNLSFKAQFIKGTHEFLDERLRFLEDSEWALRLERRGLELRYNANALADHLHQVDLDISLARMWSVGRSLTQLQTVSPENFHRTTHGLLAQKSGLKQKALLLLIDPLLGRMIYTPLARWCQKWLIVDWLYAACHASSLLGGIRKGMRDASQSHPATAEAAL